VTKPSTPSGASAFFFQISLVAGLIGFGAYFDHFALVNASVARTMVATRAELENVKALDDVQRVARWAVGSQDPAGQPFVVVDRERSRLFAFGPQGHYLGTTPVVLAGSPIEWSLVAAPTGRFAAEVWLPAADGGIVWVTQGSGDGLLRVPREFYQGFLDPLKTGPSVGYVVPEVLPLHDGFNDDLPAMLGFNFAQWRIPTRSPS
jgi:hypothetical protein